MTVAAARAADDERLRRLVRKPVAVAASQGTTTIETKAGYGLDVAHELRSSQIAAGEVDDLTFLGAHLVPSAIDGIGADDYVRLVCGSMLEAVAPHVQWADVFCERDAFDEDQAREVLLAAHAKGLGLRVHGNQLGTGPGVQLAVELGAASVDHVNFLNDADVEVLADSWRAPSRAATVLPACDLSTRAPLAPARRLLDAGVPVALASNCNPGTSYTSSMALCVATAILQMHLTVAKAVRAAMQGGALPLGRHTGAGAVGSIAVGHRADLYVLEGPVYDAPGLPPRYAADPLRVAIRPSLGRVGFSGREPRLRDGARDMVEPPVGRDHICDRDIYGLRRR